MLLFVKILFPGTGLNKLLLGTRVSCLVDFLKFIYGIMSIDLGSSQRRMSQEFLDRVQLGTLIQKTGGNAMSKDVGRFATGKTIRFTEFLLNYLIHVCRIEFALSIGEQKRFRRFSGSTQ